MNLIDIIVGIIGLDIALWALNLQRIEIVKNGKITSLIHTAALLQNRIDLLSKIIDDKKALGKEPSEWGGLEATVNKKGADT